MVEMQLMAGVDSIEELRVWLVRNELQEFQGNASDGLEDGGAELAGVPLMPLGVLDCLQNHAASSSL